MNPLPDSAFHLTGRTAAKADPAQIGADEEQFAAIAATLEQSVADLTARVADALARAGGAGQDAMDRDLEVHRLAGRLRTLRRSGLDLCLGRMVPADGGDPTYVGRLGLTDADGRRLLVDWRAPAAEPFFAATHADPQGLASRRRYRWDGGRFADYWDEVFAGDLSGPTLDDQSAFIAGLGASRSQRMRDVLATIQADQDAIVRAGSRGVLVVDGGPGTGKTVVALHRTAYLLYSDPRLGHRRGGVLFVGPHQPYLSYVADVLPSLGEEGVATCTVRDLVPEGASAPAETDPDVARLKSGAALVDAIEAAVALYEEPPTGRLRVETDWARVRVDPEDWSDAFDAVRGVPHNEAREVVLEELVAILVEKVQDEDVPTDALRQQLERDPDLRSALHRAWPLLLATDVVGDLWSVPAYLRRCAPHLHPDEVRSLQRGDPHAWTTSDLPLLDAARARLGDPETSRRRRRRQAAAAEERVRRADVVADLVAADDSDLLVMTMLKGADLQNALEETGDGPDVDDLAGPFAHVVVDEAQELTDAQWRMLVRRCPSRSFTVVGDRAQARHGFAESWTERLARVGIDRVAFAPLTVNYRTPAEVMAAAEPVIRAELPDANVPTSVRSNGIPVRYGATAELEELLDGWLAGHADGTACVIGRRGVAERPRVRSLTPELVKGLEFDLVVLIEPQEFGTGIEGAVDRYVAMTRATQRLVVLTG